MSGAGTAVVVSRDARPTFADRTTVPCHGSARVPPDPGGRTFPVTVGRRQSPPSPRSDPNHSHSTPRSRPVGSSVRSCGGPAPIERGAPLSTPRLPASVPHPSPPSSRVPAVQFTPPRPPWWAPRPGSGSRARGGPVDVGPADAVAPNRRQVPPAAPSPVPAGRPPSPSAFPFSFPFPSPSPSPSPLAGVLSSPGATANGLVVSRQFHPGRRV